MVGEVASWVIVTTTSLPGTVPDVLTVTVTVSAGIVTVVCQLVVVYCTG